MKKKIDVKWSSGMEFTGVVDNHFITLDASPEVGGNDRGMRPKPLLMVSLAGCTAMDVISILKKMKSEVTYFNVSVEGELTEEHPMHYTSMHIIYEVKGKNIPISNVEKAVNLSLTKYCGVSATLRKALSITHEIKVLQEE